MVTSAVHDIPGGGGNVRGVIGGLILFGNDVLDNDDRGRVIIIYTYTHMN